jgi:hypothetical protein
LRRRRASARNNSPGRGWDKRIVVRQFFALDRKRRDPDGGIADRTDDNLDSFAGDDNRSRLTTNDDVT